MAKQCDMSDYCPLCKAYNRLSASEAGRHLLNAKREMLLAFKTLLEGEIEKTGQPARSRRARKVKIG